MMSESVSAIEGAPESCKMNIESTQDTETQLNIDRQSQNEEKSDANNNETAQDELPQSLEKEKALENGVNDGDKVFVSPKIGSFIIGIANEAVDSHEDSPADQTIDAANSTMDNTAADIPKAGEELIKVEMSDLVDAAAEEDVTRDVDMTRDGDATKDGDVTMKDISTAADIEISIKCLGGIETDADVSPRASTPPPLENRVAEQSQPSMFTSTPTTIQTTISVASMLSNSPLFDRVLATTLKAPQQTCSENNDPQLPPAVLTIQSSVFTNGTVKVEDASSNKKGPPATTRFLKNLDVTALTGHHYNPFLYTQSKSKPFSPFQVDSYKGQDKVITAADVKNHRGSEPSTINGVECVPVYHMSGEDMLQDPITFYEKVRAVGEQYGCVKIVPASTWENNFAINTDSFWFKTRKQSTTSFKDETMRKVEFHKALYEFHKSRGSLGKIPSIDKRTLDLYRLRTCVKQRGGFEAVCQRKLWAQIGRELGYSGRIMSSLSTSLRSAYLKVLHEFDLYEDKKRPAEDGETEQAPKKVCIEIPQVAGSNVEFQRQRDVMKLKGFKTNWDSVTEVRKGLTVRDSSTSSDYDFNFWHKGMEVWDKSFYESKNSPIYNFRQFFLKDCKFLSGLNQQFGRFPVDFETFENVYWSSLGSEFDMDSAFNLPSLIHGSGFPIPGKGSTDTANIADPWNLNNVALSAKSLLRFLPSEQDNMTRTKLDVTMCFSTVGWSPEDQFLPMIDHLHVGAPKLWYVIPASEFEKYEQLVQEVNLQESQEFDLSKEIENDGFKKSDFFNSFADTNVCTATPPNRDGEEQTLLLPRDYQFPPELLQSKGIKFFKVTQNAGEFVMKFPKAVSSTVSCGFSVSEKTHFAPEDWLAFGLSGEEWLSSKRRLPNIPMFPLLFALKNTNKTADKLYHEIVEKDNELRKSLPETVVKVKDQFDCISDEDLMPTRNSKIVVVNKDESWSMTLKGFIEKSDLEASTVELHEFIRNDEQWKLQYEKVTCEPVIELTDLRELNSHHIDTPEAKYLEKYLQTIESLVKDCHTFLRPFTPLENVDEADILEVVNLPYSVAPFNELLKKLSQHATITSAEIAAVTKLAESVRDFQTEATSVLGSEASIEDLKSLYQRGQTLGFELEIIELLRLVINRKLCIIAFENLPAEVILENLQKLEASCKLYLSKQDTEFYQKVVQKLEDASGFEIKDGSYDEILETLDRAKSDRIPLPADTWKRLKSCIEAHDGWNKKLETCTATLKELQDFVKRHKSSSILDQYAALAKEWLTKCRSLKLSDGIVHQTKAALTEKPPSEEIYCYCRDEEQGGSCVQCEKCNEWYHTVCTSDNATEFNDDDEFICAVCTGTDPSRWHIDFADLKSLYESAATLKVVPETALYTNVCQAHNLVAEFIKGDHTKDNLRKMYGSGVWDLDFIAACKQ